jgi:APA family basic amino acid/polyamine antiporter
VVAALALALLTIINCLGVRAGATVQSFLMVLKILAIVALVLCGLFLTSPRSTNGIHVVAGGFGASDIGAGLKASLAFLTMIGAAMVPVLFAYGGWQTATFVAGEIREPGKNLPRALVIGVTAVVVLYLAVNFVCVRALGISGLANTTTPASDVMRMALGPTGARLIAAGIAISTLGFLSQSMLTAPRVYFAMAEDGLFFGAVAKLSPRSRVPVIAIVMQGLLATAIALSGKYEQILNYVVSVDFIFFGLTAMCVFIFRRRLRGAHIGGALARVPGHPLTTALFIAVCWLVVINTVYQYPRNTLIGLAILLAGIPAYFLWQRGHR